MYAPLCPFVIFIFGIVFSVIRLLALISPLITTNFSLSFLSEVHDVNHFPTLAHSCPFVSFLFAIVLYVIRFTGSQ
jgi:hypothetical protein